jgi:DNA-binding transcriptional ArsR family regulator
MEFSTEHWANHRQGEQTRAEILATLAQTPYLSIAEISRQIGKGDRQVRRQLKALLSESKVRKEGTRYISA